MATEKRLEYKDVDTPVGRLRLVATSKGLAAVLWEGEDLKRTKLDHIEQGADNPILIEAALQLNDYFNNKRTDFTVPLDCEGTVFQKRVWEALLGIAFGETKTYGQLAEILGDKHAVRAVGGALNKNLIAIIVPCHRVVGASGKLVGFAGGVRNKAILLDLERQQRVPDLFNQF